MKDIKKIKGKTKGTRDIFKEICDFANYGVAIVDPEGNLEYLNKTFARSHGYKPEELIGKNLTVFHTKEQLLRVNKLNKRLKKEGKYSQEEVMHVRKNGEVFPMLMSAVTIKDQKGKNEFLVAMGVDISSRKNAEEALRESEERFSQIAENEGKWIWEVDAKGLYTYASPVVKKILGYKPEEIVGKKHFYDFFKPDEKDQMKQGAFEAFAQKESFSDFINSNIHKSGKVVVLSTDGVPVLDEKGRLLGYRGVDTDITKQTEAEEALKESEEKFQQIANTIKDVFWVMDAKTGQALYISPAYKKIWGRSVKEIYDDSENWVKAIHKDDRERVAKAYAEMFKNGDFDEDYRILHKDKSIRWVRDRGYPIKNNNGEVYRLVGIVQDITNKKEIEEKLKESEEKFRTLFNNSKDALMTLEPPTWKFTSGNPSIVKMFGVKDEKEFLSLRPWEVSPKYQPDGQLSNIKAKKMIQKALKEGINFFEWTHKKVGGRNFYATVLLSKITLEGKDLLQATVRDITEKKSAEEKLKESEEKFRTLFNNSKDALMTLEPPTWKFTSGNPSIVKMFGVKDEKEFLSLRPWEVSPKYQPDGQLSNIKAKKMIQKALKEGINFFEWTHKKVGGRNFYATVLLSKITLEGKDLLQATVRDITEKKSAEEKLKESEEKYRSIFEIANDVIMLFDKTGTIVDINSRIRNITGYTREEMIGRNLLEMPEFFASEKDAELILGNFKKRIEGEEIKDYELNLIKKNKKPIVVEVNAVLLKKEGDIVGDLAILRDITERKKIEQMKTDFISIASHQLRTPLVGIKWVLERFLKKEQISEEGREYLKNIQDSSRRLTDLVDLLLNVSRFEGGRIVVTLKPLDTVGFIKGILEENKSLSTKKELSVIFEKRPDKLDVVTDPTLFRNIIQSIVSNAMEYTPEKGCIEIELEKKEKSFLVKASDNGIGIPKEDQPTIFDKFTRGKNAVTMKTGGVGLGLYAVKESIDLLGGKITFDSEVGKGTTFYIELPLESKPQKGKKRLHKHTNI